MFPGLVLVVVTTCLGGVASKNLPPLDANNLRDPYRPAANPEWATKWGSPTLLDGSKSRPEKGTDMALYDGDVKLFGSTAWVYFLYPFQWEREWTAYGFGLWIRRWWLLAPVVAISYVCLLWLGIHIMESRKAFDLKGLLAVWNFTLAVFSWITVMRTLPHLIYMISETSFDWSLCRAACNSVGHGAAGFWMTAFVMSKFAELFDTVFLVLRKKPVGFLHWYHHCTVLLYCWHTYLLEAPAGFHFMTVNSSVHAVMYLYYFLAAVQAKPPKWGRFVTIMQLSQMVVGIVLVCRHLHLLQSGLLVNCDGYIPNLVGALAMYASYFLLFAQFFVQRYCGKRKGNLTGKGLKSE